MSTVIMTENFEDKADNALITDTNTYSFASFPNAGSSGAANPSDKWECDTGWLYCKVDSSSRHWGYSGRPVDWPDKYFYRLNTRVATAADQIVEMDYKSADFGVGGYAVEGSDATDVWMRYQTQYWLYVVQFDRTNDTFVCKRKVPTNDNGQWLGPANNIANKGCYYTLFTDSEQPVFGAGHGGNVDSISWVGVQSLLAAENTKPNWPKLAHDGTSSGGTLYHFKMTITTIPHSPFDWVQIKLYRGGVLVGSWTDKNDCTAANTARTFQQDWDNGYFNNVTGKTAAWGFPIYTAGKSGMRADNIQVWFDNFVLSDANATPTQFASAGVGSVRGVQSITLS